MEPLWPELTWAYIFPKIADMAAPVLPLVALVATVFVGAFVVSMVRRALS
jgi:hypothetical protein